uniref:Peptidase S1 domain-containing protein n=1 Tax=Bombyx mori TaxID=7091 RepID=A0A8R2R0X1_BOMMO|nr:uncharacterized protein LOC101740348 isoform X3 [Bombyx mori]
MAFINIISINSCIPSLLLILLVSAQTKPQPALVSPCPSVFEYDTSIQHPGRWYGVIKLSSDYTIHSLWLNIHLDDNYSEAFKNCLGSVTQENKYEFMINRTDFVINPGEVKKVQIYVEYNITSSPPKMIGIAFNGRRICGPSFVLSLLHSDYRYHGTDMRGCPYRPSALPPSSEEETSSNPTYNIQSTTDSGVVSNPTNKTENKDVDDLFGGPVSFALPDTVNNFHNKSERSRCGRIYAKSPLVIGEAIETIHWPWQVLILRSISAHTYHMTDFKYRCSGTLVSTRHVITAAHCLTVRGQLIERDFEFIDAGRHQLRVNEDRIFVGGWGFDQSGEPNELLTTIEMSEVDTQSCLQAHDASLANYLTDKVYCAKYVNGTSNCHKDSGGGMMVRVKNKWYLRGVLSFYYSPELQHACQSHALFTDVAKHLPWIKQHVYDFL